MKDDADQAELERKFHHVPDTGATKQVGLEGSKTGEFHAGAGAGAGFGDGMRQRSTQSHVR